MRVAALDSEVPVSDATSEANAEALPSKSFQV
jgi:hypothetical protein